MTARPGDLYAVLGVAGDATQRDIDHAFRALLRRYHPDSRQPQDEVQGASSDAALQDAFAAYSVLGVPARRVAYDRATASTAQPSPAPPPVARPRPHDARPPIVVGPVLWRPSSRRRRGPG